MMQKAFLLFDQGNYRDAFKEFAAIYNETSEEAKRADIMDMLFKTYYEPNQAELQKMYDSNVKALSSYPYIWEAKFPDFSDLSFLLFPTSDETYFLYDKTADQFLYEYDALSDQCLGYCFENLDHAIQVEQEDNLYNLTFLFDNVRSSEDVGADNHIYLLYNEWETIQRLIQIGDLAPLLKKEKFVFLVGNAQREKYPLDFKTEFGIDYASMTPSPVRLEEVKRICYWYKHAHSGTVLSIGLLGSLSDVVAVSGHDFHTYSKFPSNEERLRLNSLFQTPDKEIPINEIIRLLQSGLYEIKLRDIDAYLPWLQNRYPEKSSYTVKELFIGYFLYQYEKKGVNSRIVPVLLYDPHIWKNDFYNPLIESFEYHLALTSVREPIMTFMRCYTIGIAGWNDFQDKYLLASDYVHAQYLSAELKKKYYGWRFEDLKRYPEKLLPLICRLINVPFDEKMLEQEVPMTDRHGHTVKGFDQSPLHYDMSSILSDFDKLRLQIFYEPIQRYYGYPTFDSSEYPLSEAEVRKLFSYPFRFERINLYNQDSKIFHERIQFVLQNFWRKKISVPTLITPEEEQ